MNRRVFLAVVAVLALPLPAQSTELTPFSADAFEKAQAEGRPILVHVTAPWCGTCRAQKRVLPDLLASPELAGMLWLDVDFDTQPDIRRVFDVQHQSTMVVFKGSKEVARAVGETRPDALRELLSMAL
ncbi:MAG: thioredoxin family protein [Rhizobiales bacterium]|nr:thioredoxin family protein [Hyphomicrobiales bacterium]